MIVTVAPVEDGPPPMFSLKQVGSGAGELEQLESDGVLTFPVKVTSMLDGSEPTFRTVEAWAAKPATASPAAAIRVFANFMKYSFRGIDDGMTQL